MLTLLAWLGSDVSCPLLVQQVPVVIERLVYHTILDGTHIPTGGR